MGFPNATVSTGVLLPYERASWLACMQCVQGRVAQGRAGHKTVGVSVRGALSRQARVVIYIQ
jgi:hypothetical protein